VTVTGDLYQPALPAVPASLVKATDGATESTLNVAVRDPAGVVLPATSWNSGLSTVITPWSASLETVFGLSPATPEVSSEAMKDASTVPMNQPLSPSSPDRLGAPTDGATVSTLIGVCTCPAAVVLPATSENAGLSRSYSPSWPLVTSRSSSPSIPEISSEPA
jgi:hypothetical protein